jgi:hypothetical protein
VKAVDDEVGSTREERREVEGARSSKAGIVLCQ